MEVQENKNIDITKIILYDVNDIQEIFKCGKRQSYQLIHTNGFPSIKIGKKILVEKTALEKWIDQNKGKTVLFN